MPFQTQVKAGMALGVPGQKCTQNPVSVLSKIAEEPVTVAHFAWIGADPAKQVKNSGTGKPLGIVVRDVLGIITTFLDETQNTILTGQPVEVATQGEFFVTGSGVSTHGQAVFAVLADGTLKFGTPGATIAGAVESNYKVLEGGASGALVKISSWI